MNTDQVGAQNDRYKSGQDKVIIAVSFSRQISAESRCFTAQILANAKTRKQKDEADLRQIRFDRNITGPLKTGTVAVTKVLKRALSAAIYDGQRYFCG